jgi:hypothetical protein
VVRDRIDEQLMAQARSLPVACHQRSHGREVASSRVAADRDAARIDAERLGLVGHPADGGEGVLGGGREPVLRGQAVLDRHHGAARAVGQLAAGAVVGLDRTEGPAAAVEVHQAGQLALSLGPVDPHAQAAIGPGQLPVLTVGDIGPRPLGRSHVGGLPHRRQIDGGQVEIGAERFAEGLRLGIDRHGAPFRQSGYHRELRPKDVP